MTNEPQDHTRLLFCVGDISLGNLPEGDFRITAIDRSAALERLGAFASTNDLIGLFDFSSVPDRRRKKTFHDVLENLTAGPNGVSIHPKTFFMSFSDPTPADLEDATEETDTDEALGGLLPNPPELFQVSPRRPMLIATYYFELLDSASWDKNEPFRFKLSDRMDFRWLEALRGT